MSKLNYNEIEPSVQSAVTAITTTSTTATFLYDALSLRAIDNKISNYFTDTNSLPDVYLCNISNGCVVFVESLNIPVMANQYKWMGLDGRLLRADDPTREIWAWGFNNYGQLGNNSTIRRSSPVSVIGGFTDWCQVSAGDLHTTAIKSNGTAWAWGRNYWGQLGNNGSTSSSPVSVLGGFTDWCRVSAGLVHSVGIRYNGTIWSWGNNGGGALGNGTTQFKTSPVSVVGGFTDWCYIDAGSCRSVGLRTNGTIWTWGGNNDGPLGDGTTVNRSSPVSVVGGFTDWCQISISNHISAIRNNGTLWAWGRNSYGTLGDNTQSNRSSPVSIVGGFTDWCQVSAGQYNTAAVRTNGSIWVWGRGVYGQMGNNTAVARSSPVSVSGGFTDWVVVSAGINNIIGIRANGTLWTWGRNNHGQLGDGTTINKSSPVSILGGFTDWYTISDITDHVAVIRRY